MERTEYTFASFCTDIKERVRKLNARLADPTARWPGVLFLDVPDGLDAEKFELDDLTDAELEELARITLPARLRDKNARRFCWATPGWRRLDDVWTQEYLLLILGERERWSGWQQALSSSLGRGGEHRAERGSRTTYPVAQRSGGR